MIVPISSSSDAIWVIEGEKASGSGLVYRLEGRSMFYCLFERFPLGEEIENLFHLSPLRYARRASVTWRYATQRSIICSSRDCIAYTCQLWATEAAARFNP